MVFNNLVGALGSGFNLGGLFGGSSAGKGFPKILRATNLIDAVIKTGASGFVKLGQFTVVAQTEQSWGFGQASAQEAGRLFADIEDSGDADEDGLVRLAAANANETAIDVVQEIRTDLISENPTDITKQVWFPEVTSYPVLGRRPREDDLLQLYMDFDTDTGDVSRTNSLINIHTTVYQ